MLPKTGMQNSQNGYSPDRLCSQIVALRYAPENPIADSGNDPCGQLSDSVSVVAITKIHEKSLRSLNLNVNM